VQKLKRATASLWIEKYLEGREHGSFKERKPLKRRHQAIGFDEKA
jgi:hypothetical protein